MPARTTRDRTIGIAVAVVLLLVLGWAATRHADDRATRDEQTLSALRRSGIESPRADITGMVATVYGLADDADERDGALRAVGRVDGIRDVVDRLTITATPSPAPERVAGDPDKAPGLSDGPRLAAGTATTARPTSPAQPTTARPAPATPRPRARTGSAKPVEVARDAPCEAVPSGMNGARVGFDKGTATVSKTGRSTLRSIGEHMVRCPNTVLRVEARATQAASTEANLKLSKLRSQAVSNHLDMHGVAVTRLVATYRGDRAPHGDHADLTMYAEVPR